MSRSSIPMQSRYFRGLRRAIWRWRCVREYRRRLNELEFLQGADPWPEDQIQQLADSTVQNQIDSNDRDGYAWDSPGYAVDEELACWSE